MKLKEILSYSFSGLMAVCMIAVVVLMVRLEFFSPSSARTTPQQHQPVIREIRNWQQLELNGQRSGPANASVQIVEFFDYECPFCKATQPAVKAVRKKYSQKVTVIHENFPLQRIHPYAFKAAVAAECVRLADPTKFMAYHDSLFIHQNELSQFSYAKLAFQIGIPDSTAFHQCVENQRTAPVIQTSSNLAKNLNIRAIPTFIINGKLVTGVLSERQLNGLVKDALAKGAK